MIRSRLTWLDALRGYAAVVVALFHLSPTVIGRERHLAMHEHFDFGRYGVLLFFVVSGYVIPMSLERHGSLRRFWVGRLFRIYPAYLLAGGVSLILVFAGWQRLEPTFYKDTVATVLGHVTMLSDLLGMRTLTRPMWTLSYEMIFYLIVAGLFVWRRHRDSAWWAAGLALIVLVAGRALPPGLFAGTFDGRRITGAVLVVLVLGCVAAYLSGRRGPALVAGVVGLGMVLLPLLNGQPTWYATPKSSSNATLMLAVMFCGTVIYRAQHGQLDRRVAAAVLTLVTVVQGINQWLLDGTQLLRNCLVAGAVAGSFAIAFLLRNRAFPAFLSWLGLVSFSVYLLHMPVLAVAQHFLRDHPFQLFAAFVVGTLVVSWAAYHLVERPGQELGRRVESYLEGRFGPATRVSIANTEGGTPSTGSFGLQRESV
ncbi:acyltransferase family protein [Actinoplanes regularis]|uniref:Peptidoglycan/LPS O-acetylase OafA/YrhL, contains acyltransferase and SGNH-hydrolase domains n=1 Tax=Actinoplanes regularis TaxID=52697 RepID=A0A238XXW3_9ACTN|nr:acyltransferase [Actinoplanes regularis]GIE87791.1 hypothetical protein Are01nite_42710 [Actinoplanes regularis]SNR63263.1 Peptidoglycan/LPS O-acetylase OafA/YrhL, contains acyltransferase and SGNH-hydrolase domains [Actinoplanes regularis]